MIVVTNCGHDSKHKSKFEMIRKTGVPNYILLLVKTEAFFEISGEIIQTNPNMAILFNRNTCTHYGSSNSTYNDDWIHFDFLNESSLLDRLSIPFNEPIYVPYINQLSNYVRLLVQEKSNSSLHKDAITDALMRTLLYSLDSQITKNPETVTKNKHYYSMNQLRTNIHNTPHKKWTIDYMAQSVNLSPSYFQHLYKDLFHISCVQEVILARMERAKFYLKTTDMSIKSLSDFCGYDNELHFMRQFKKLEGMTPSEYRKFFK